MPERCVVLLHGQPGTGSDWSAVAARLSADVRSLALDRPGYGSSPLAPGGFRANARAVLDEIDAQDIEEAVLVGHSYGGGVALATAQLAPQRIRGLVLVSSIGPGCLNGWDRLLAAPVVGPACALVAWWLTPWLGGRWLAGAERLRHPPSDNQRIYLDSWSEARHRHESLWRTFLVEQRALVHDLDTLIQGLPTIWTPTLVLGGQADIMIPIETARTLSCLLPSARLVEIPNVGHQLPGLAPQVVADAIEEVFRTP